MGPNIPGQEDDGPGTFRLYSLSKSDSLGPMDGRSFGFCYISPIPAPYESAIEAVKRCWTEVILRASADGFHPTLLFAGIGLQNLTSAVVPMLCTALGAWLGSRNGRKVRIKVAYIEADAQTREELEKVLERAREIQQEIQQRNQTTQDDSID